ncbi:GNAT family N-acetyltransferase [Bacillus sp. 31A1R]|uniref:GNAT family N-acetyltransferase n=1 Tax=Robertmurraya mangrovi TaxID=3098077 RepID=A0ABU5IVW3_9BACI|nr:GNAT family N-acetyltransferase [Bacillus sp. 31A1R]MDZ5471298.1 GNAT family N-acetyltransferase [Bacillus sp. 31A1R]
MEIRLAIEEDLKSILSVLNESALHLQRKGINQWSYPWNSQVILTEVSANHAFVLTKEDFVIGTFFIHEIKELSDLAIEADSKYLSKVALMPEYQGKGLGKMITDFAQSYAKTSRKALYLDCWAGNEKLKKFYLRNGFEFVGVFPEEDYFISVFKFN